MSRHIQTADPESRKLNNLTQNGKLILTYIKEKAVALLLRDDMLISVQVIDNTDTLQVGEVYIGKIKNSTQVRIPGFFGFYHRNLPSIQKHTDII